MAGGATVTTRVWGLGQGVRLAVAPTAALRADQRRLTPTELEAMAALRHVRARRADWIRGRLLVRKLLPASAGVVVAPGGAPRVVEGDHAVSISHEPGWIAAAVRPGADARLAIDLTLRRDRPRIASALHRLGVDSDVAPEAAWAALECALKLTQAPFEALLGGGLAVHVCWLSTGGDAGLSAVVHGLGAPLLVQLFAGRGYLVACSTGGAA